LEGDGIRPNPDDQHHEEEKPVKKIIRSKKLNLSQQTIRTLQVDELRQVAGAADTQDGCVSNDTCAPPAWSVRRFC
jgi:hypothetical protein